MTHAVSRKRPAIERLENRTLLTSVVVNSISDTDTGVVTLRDAIAIANASTDPTTITFDPTVFATAQTIVLGGTQLALTNTAEPTTITGPAADVTISGNNTSRVLEVYENVTATLTGVNITDGNSFDDDGDGTGGGIFNVGNLTFANANITGNTGQAGGGGINNSGKVTLTNVTISNNTAGDHGGGLENFGARLGNATAVLTNVTVTGNSIGNHQGGGIASDTNGLTGTTTLILNNVTVTNNTASSDGGGIFLDSSSINSAMTNVTVLDNTAPGNGGGIAEEGGAATLSRSTIDDNTASNGNSSLGGGLYVAGTLTVSNSTINGNSTPFYGGGIDVGGGNLTLINDTIADNSAGGVGGLNNGLNATTTLEEVTISGNSTSTVATAPGGVANTQGAVLITSNSIIAGNSNAIAGNYPDVAGQFTSLGHNLIGAIDHSTGWSGSDLAGTVASPVNADLGALADNGGTTKTLLPLTGSPAIGVGSVALIPAGIQTDQRGVGRTVDGLVDIGAVEVGGAVVTSAASVTAFTASAQTVLLGNADTFTITVASADAGGPVPTGTISIYQDGILKGAFSLVGGTVTQSITATKAIANTVYTVVYGGDANYAASTSNSVTQTYLTKSAVTGKIGKAIVPVMAIGGQKFTVRVPVTLTNTGPTVKGNLTETLYLDSASVPDSALGASPVQLAKVVKRTTLKPGKSFAVLLGANVLPATVPAGTYHLVVKTTDLYGDVDLVTLDRTITVAAPFVALGATVGAVKPPIVVINGIGSVVVTLVNNGNVTAAGFLVLAFSPSSDGVTPLPGFVLTKPTFHVSIKPGKSGKYTLKFRVPIPLTAGNYYPLVTVSLGAVTTTAVGSQFTAG